MTLTPAEAGTSNFGPLVETNFGGQTQSVTLSVDNSIAAGTSADLNLTVEGDLDSAGLETIDVLVDGVNVTVVDGGTQCGFFTRTISIPAATLAPLIADGQITISFASSIDVNFACPGTGVFAGSGPFFFAVQGSLTYQAGGNKTVGVIAQYMRQRTNLLLSNEPDGSRQVDRLNEIGGAGDQSGPGFASSPSPGIAADFGAPWRAGNVTRMPLGHRERMLASGREQSPFPSSFARDVNGDITGVVPRVTGNGDDPMRFDFAASLSRVQRRNAEAEAKKLDRMGLDAGALPSTHPRFTPVDVWIQGKYARFLEKSAGDADGHFAVVSIGTDYVVNRSLLIGALLQLDSMRQSSTQTPSEISGVGWMAGPYATLRLTEHLFWQGRAAWGQSSNDVSPLATYTDTFDTTRWLVSTTVTGQWYRGPWTFRPSVSVAYMDDTAERYIDALGVATPSVKSRLGQAKAGPEILYRYQFSPDLTVEPRARLELIWNFADDTMAVGLGQIDGQITGVRGRAEIGVQMVTPDGIGFDLSAGYDGIGGSDEDAIIATATLRVPLH